MWTYNIKFIVHTYLHVPHNYIEKITGKCAARTIIKIKDLLNLFCFQGSHICYNSSTRSLTTSPLDIRCEGMKSQHCSTTRHMTSVIPW